MSIGSEMAIVPGKNPYFHRFTSNSIFLAFSIMQLDDILFSINQFPNQIKMQNIKDKPSKCVHR